MEYNDDNYYNLETVQQHIDNDSMSPEEAAFMQGYLEAA